MKTRNDEYWTGQFYTVRSGVSMNDSQKARGAPTKNIYGTLKEVYRMFKTNTEWYEH